MEGTYGGASALTAARVSSHRQRTLHLCASGRWIKGVELMSPTSTTPALPGVVRLLAPEEGRRLAAARHRAAERLDSSDTAGHRSPADVDGMRPPASAAQHLSTQRLSTQLTVECDDAEIPRRLCWRDRWHVVVEDPVRWFERRRWWLEDSRAERGRGPGVVDHEIWRLQIRLEAAPRAMPRTVDLSRHTGSGRWRLLRVHDVAA